MGAINSVLLVDDDEINNFINKKIIQKLNISTDIHIVKNGMEALKYVVEYSPEDNRCPELIFLDIEMPVMDGIEFIESFNELQFVNKEEVKIIVLSAVDFSLYACRYQQCQLHSFITKPLTEEKVAEVLKKGFQYTLS